MMDQTRSLIDTLVQKIFDKKGFNIFVLDVREISSLTNYFLIAEGNVERHVKSLAREVVATAEDLGFPPFHIEGGETGDWMVIDLGSIIVHLFGPELRQKYALEELWKEGTIVDVAIDIGKGDVVA